MSNPLLPGEAPSSGPASASRWRHSLLAAAAGFVALVALLFAAAVYIGRPPASMDFARGFGITMLISVLAGTAVLPFRRLRWYWAVLAGSAISLSLALVFTLATN